MCSKQECQTIWKKKKTFDPKLIYMKQPKEKQPPSGGKSTVQRIHKDPSPSGLQCATYKNIWQIKELVLNVGTRGNQKKKKNICVHFQKDM